jgi:hypothetical protein
MNMKKLLSVVASLLIATSAEAGGWGVGININLGFPIYTPVPVVYVAAPVVCAAPVYIPRQVVYVPAPVVYAPAPVVYPYPVGISYQAPITVHFPVTYHHHHHFRR